MPLKTAKVFDAGRIAKRVPPRTSPTAFFARHVAYVHEVEPQAFHPTSSGGELVLHQAATAEGFDVVFPILHGPNDEDGTDQGVLKLAGIACVGSSVLGSAVCMDKVITKAVLASPRSVFRCL